MVSVGDAETGGYRDCGGRRCQWVTPRLVATETMEGEMVSVGDADTQWWLQRISVEGEGVSG